LNFGRLTLFCDNGETVMNKALSLEELFKGRHFDREIIILCVRWYLRYKLSYRDLVEMMAERGLEVAHTTIMRWPRASRSEIVKRLAKRVRLILLR
jgi:transposase-like protein